MRRLPILLVAVCACRTASTDFECRWADGPISIDGTAAEPAWRAAQEIDTFRAHWDRRDARTATRARLLWDRGHVYFFAEMEDAHLVAGITEHDGRLWENDVFELFFKPAEDKTGYYEFEINPAGAVLDIFIPKRLRDS